VKNTVGVVLMGCLLGLVVGCKSGLRSVTSVSGEAPGTPLKRAGDEIMVCGQLFHTGAPVVLWTDPGGYDA
jgi:hypothetical protein